MSCGAGRDGAPELPSQVAPVPAAPHAPAADTAAAARPTIAGRSRHPRHSRSGRDLRRLCRTGGDLGLAAAAGDSAGTEPPGVVSSPLPALPLLTSGHRGPAVPPASPDAIERPPEPPVPPAALIFPRGCRSTPRGRPRRWPG
ncbi:hypothetical protein B4U45_24470 [Mycobacterium persicum]|uniref:Uncharacterized protein n=1 Tax=Mycobacterium persicum TaxID=1487726 RepID=A0A8E2IWL9_9MYCO|nr:hypothetical protein A4G31_22985 [Mycobacterium persicum]ORB47820.1 hypothetical protein BST40_14915 [Mycobacterium persicum]ORB91782.1 hypothetical protein B1T49_23920 [Mycobacterium persicum]ORC03820.1 hypothetical protein B1T48_23865 [Mycobacterium persicum]ORC09284.1 hypothetical protein B4U45_24470 [Mycobacterium persicum]